MSERTPTNPPLCRCPPQVSYEGKNGRTFIQKCKGLLGESCAQARFQLEGGEWRTVQQHNEARSERRSLPYLSPPRCTPRPGGGPPCRSLFFVVMN